MIRRPPRSTHCISSAASDVYKRQIEAIIEQQIDFKDIKFFVGYSGWSAGQLEREVKSDSWILQPATLDYVFDETPESLWRTVLYQKGGNFRVLSTYPDDPTLN